MIRIATYALICLAGVFALLLTNAGASVGAAEPARGRSDVVSGPEGFKADVAPFFKAYCVDCHGPDKNKGGITVHSLHGDLSKGQELDKWEAVLDMLEFGEMPPADQPQPTDAQTQAVIRWIETGMRDYVEQASQAEPEPTTRRLTNVEYQNTLGELLGFEFDVIDDLPEDPEKLYHFNNTADLMRIGPEQLDRYLEIARSAMRSAIVDPQKPEVFKMRRAWSSAGVDRGMGQDEVGVWGNRRNTAANGISFTGFPETGEFRIRMQASAILPEGYDEAPLNLDLGTEPGRTQTPYKTVATVRLTNSPDDPKVYEFTGRIENHPSAPARQGKNGPLVEKLALRPRLVFDDGTLNDGYGNTRQLELPRAVINWIEIEAPVTDTWPPKHHTDILFDSPLRETDEDAYVREVLSRFMSRAYRRPATVDEVARFAQVYRLVRPSVDRFEQAMRETLAMVLISPQFLYHTESDPATDAHYAMASRLSYFLWASMPDAQLLDLAAQRKLDDPAVIERQVLRMLADERADGFIENFTLQWLSIEKMRTVPINKDLYPRFLYLVDRGETAGTEVPYLPTVRDYMMRETVGFVGELIRNNRGALNIVDSDFAVLNERLAAHYGVEGVKGTAMRVVPIKPEHHLGGLLTHGSVLIGNGTGTAPHPIYRAVWLREAILGDEVAPPPSEVPALSDSAGESLEKALSIADLLAKHRTVESCNDCHFRLDPWGIPFEDYNAIGRYQPKVPKDGTRVSRFNAKTHGDLDGYQDYLDSINTVEVDATARVPHGPEVDGMRELKDYLLDERGDDIAENVIRRLLTYAVGRELTYRDRFAVQALFEQAEKNDFKMRDIIVSICLSDVFNGEIPTNVRK
jgi:mono/diheme cytochrome c family protein